MKIVLASSSPRRKELIKSITENAICIPANIDESVPDGIPVFEIPEFLAVQKAKCVFASQQDAVVIGCDTLVILNGKIFGKPKDKSEAKNMLKELSGKTHEVITGCAVFCGEKHISFSEVSKVTFFNLTDDEIEEYVSSGEPLDKAGAYGIQGKAALFVEKIDGDYNNIVGLPVARLNKYLKLFLK